MRAGWWTDTTPFHARVMALSCADHLTVHHGTADLTLERNEVIALLNLLARFSDSLEIYHNLTQELHKQEPALAPAVSVGAPVT